MTAGMIILVSLLATRAHGESAASLAWWLTASFTPTGTEVAGVPISAIDAEWVAASPLDRLPLPPQATAPGESVAEHGGAFSLTHDFDRDGKLENAVVGVYRTTRGEHGRFLVILGEGATGAVRVRAIFRLPGSAGFSVLQLQNDEVSWATCMECDVFSMVRYRERQFQLEHFSCEDCG